MSKLTALVEAAAQTASEPNSKPLRENFFTLASPATILELCALLEKAEDIVELFVSRWGLVPAETDDGCYSNDPYEIKARSTLTAIKQWKEMK